MNQQTFKKPDLNAPRFRPKVLSLLNRELYDKFIAKYPKYQGISCEEFKNIIDSFNRKIYRTAIDNRDGIELPESLGYIFIGSCEPPKRKRNNINFGLSIKHNTRVMNRNLGSDSFLCKIFYTNCTSKYRFLHREIWQFEPSKEFSKKTSESYRINWKNYIQVENNRKISSLYKNRQMKDWVRTKKNDTPEEYNEFQMD